MFNWFKHKPVEQTTATDDMMLGKVAESTVTLPMPEVSEPKVNTIDNTDAEYTIGINQSGNTQLRIKLDYGSATLTMTPTGVLKLIRQLEATLDLEDEVE